MFVLTDTENCLPEYFLRVFQVCYKRRIFYGFGRGAATHGRWRLPKDNFLNFLIPLPSMSEQQEIVRFCSNIESTTLSIISRLESELGLLAEYRARLISDVITGKFDVRGVVVPEYEVVKEVTDTDVTEDKSIIATECDDVNSEVKIVAFPISAAKPKGHNQQFDDAVMIAGIVNAFYHEEYLLGRKKVQKLLYLLRRHQEKSVAAFKKKAAGPYADEVRYKGGEPIAKKAEYIVTASSRKGTVFSKGQNITQALEYIEKWGMISDFQWLVDKFRYTNVDTLELYATVDMATCDLIEANIPVSLAMVKHLIEANAEWKEKLKKQAFTDDMIIKALNDMSILLQESTKHMFTST